MVDTCGVLIDEIGYDRLSATMIAHRAGVTIGSLHQFFPDKRAVAQALALRAVDAYARQLQDRFARDGLTHWWDGVGAGIDEYIVLYRAVPGIRIVHRDDVVVGARAPDADPGDGDAIAAQLTRALTARFAVADPGRLHVALDVAVAVCAALVRFAFRRQPGGDERVLTEAKEFVQACLRHHLSLAESAAAAPSARNEGRRR
ncbi:TetR family transcriptional regulator [Micromonospora deserti]|uniref:TetR family transcriptional regulator n=1 Tax=Micromonospora deserti TaxID=2070366 RepID=A0A2W2BXJ3_9ACTN|nr:TetR family transcriptional regulator [Micromonospora deserti]